MKQNGMLVGLTGQTGAGKTLISSYLAGKGHRVIDADLVARQVVAKGSRCLVDLALEFGVEILLPDGTLNRRRLGDIVFADKEKRIRLGEITFPYIQEEIFAEVERLRQDGVPIIFLDAPTLFESGTDAHCDKIVSIIAPADTRLRRILERDGITEKQAKARMSAQHDDAFFLEHSDYVVQNGGDLADLREQLDFVLSQLIKFTEQPEDAT